MVAWDRIELPTPWASIKCSTNWATRPLYKWFIKFFKPTVSTGIEPAIFCVTGRHVNPYTTRPFYNLNQWRLTGSNRRPSACKADALPAELNLRRILLLLFLTSNVVTDDPYGNRTRDTAVKGRCLNRLTNGPFFQTESKGFEPLRQCSPPTWFPIMLLRPLGQLSRWGSLKLISFIFT